MKYDIFTAYILSASLCCPALLGLDSCSGDRDHEILPEIVEREKKNEVAFLPIVKKSSRSLITTTYNSGTTQAITDFSVYARGKSGNNLTWLDKMGLNGAAKIIRGEVSNPGASPENWVYNWKYAPTCDPQRWPESGTVDFYAISPHKPAGVLTNAGTAVSADDMTGTSAVTMFGQGTDLYLKYKVPFNSSNPATSQEDLLLALTPNIGVVAHTLVPLTFQHLLARVTVKVTSEADANTTYTVNSLSFINFKDEGSLILRSDAVTDGVSTGIPGPNGASSSSTGFTYADKDQHYAVLWDSSAQEQPTTYAYGSLNSGSGYAVTAGGGGVSLFPEGDALMVLPQQLKAGTVSTSQLPNPVVEADLVGAYLKLGYTVTRGGTTSNETLYMPIAHYAPKYQDTYPSLVYSSDLTLEVGRQYRFLVTLGKATQNALNISVSDFDDAPDSAL